MIICDASSKRSRALSIAIPKCSYSTRDSPRPRPRIARPFERGARIALVPDRVEARVARLAERLALGRQHVEAARADRRDRARGDLVRIDPAARAVAQRALGEVALAVRRPAALAVRGTVAIGLADPRVHELGAQH